MQWVETEAGRVPQCLVGNDAMQRAKVPLRVQKQVRAAFTARTQIEVSTARNLLNSYAPLARKRRTRVWPKGGLITISRALREYEEWVVANRLLPARDPFYVTQPAAATPSPAAPQPKRARGAVATQAPAASAKRPRAPPPDKCPICLENLDDASPALACGHRIHEACVRQLAATAWADGAKRTRGRGTAVLCPLCREQSYVQ